MSLEPEASPGPTVHSFGLLPEDVLPILYLVNGVAAVMSGQEPTGNIAADFVLSALFGVGVLWLARFASADALVMSSVLALFFSGFRFPAVAIAAVALVGALFMTTWRRFDSDSWQIGAAVSGAFVAQAALNLPSFRFVGSASLLAAAAVAPIVVTAFRSMPGVLRRRLVRAGVVVALFAALATALVAYAGLSVRTHLESGIEQAELGVTALEAGDQPVAGGLLDAAGANFNTARERLGGPLTWPARVVPIVAQHARALETAADEGAALARTASRTLGSADVDRIRGANGAIDLDVVAEVNVELTNANLVMRQAQESLLDVRTAWLLPAFDERLASVQAELAATTVDIDLANQATSVLPQILGAGAPRRYLVLFVQPSESREFGGFVGAYAILDADSGQLSLGESGSITDFVVGRASISEPETVPRSYRQLFPEVNPQNLTGIADLSTIAELARDLVPQWRQDDSYTIDGVITIDPYALAGFLELTGPIDVVGRDTPVTAANVVPFLLRDQYLEFDTAGRDERQEVLNVLAGAAFSELLDIEIPGPERLGAIFGPLARANRISMYTFDDQEQVLLDRVFLSAEMPQVGSAVELLGVYGATGTASKLDAYSTRSLTYVVDVDPATGRATGFADVAITNEAPADAPEYVLGLGENGASISGGLELGDNLLALSVYSAAEVDGMASPDAAFEPRDTFDALGYVRSAGVLEVPLGTTRHVTFRTETQVLPGRYDLLVTAQPAATVGDLTLVIRPTEGWVVRDVAAAADGSWTVTVPLETSQGFTFAFDRAG